MTARVRHPKKDVEKALQYGEKDGWIVEQTASGHKWGKVQCGHGCKVLVWSTPKNPGNHAKAIRKAVDNCPHARTEKEVHDA